MKILKKLIIDLGSKWAEEENKEIARQEKQRQFNEILDFADEIISEADKYRKNNSLDYKEHPIIDVIRILGRTVQSKYALNLLKGGGRLPNISIDNFIFKEYQEIPKSHVNFYNLMKEVEIERTVELQKDLVLPWPWHRRRLIDNISRIGEGRVRGTWRQDNNHRIELWLPLGISWVRSGNHSISIGIIQGTGQINPDKIYDISPIYDYVYCDGLFFKTKDDDTVIQEVYNTEFAAIFEIGRKMKEHNISF